MAPPPASVQPSVSYTHLDVYKRQRLLYVAMTRAKDDLHLMVPQRFYTYGQNTMGDRHVYAARTRFIPNELLNLFHCTAWPIATTMAMRTAAQGPRVDVAARMRGMWR